MSNKKTVLGFVAVATVAGDLAGILLAPDKGFKIRKKMSRKVENISDSLDTFYDDFADELKKASKKGIRVVDEFNEKAIIKMNGLKDEAKANLL